MDKNLLKTIFFTLLVFIVWERLGFFGKPPQKISSPSKSEIIQSDKIEIEQKKSIIHKDSITTKNDDLNVIKKNKSIDEKTIQLKTPTGEIVFSNIGGGIKSVNLQKYNTIINYDNLLYPPLSIKRIGEYENVDQSEFKISEYPDNPSQIGFKYTLKDTIDISTQIQATEHDYLYRINIILKNNGDNDFYIKDGLEIVAGNLSLDKNTPYSILNFSKYSIENKTENIPHKKIKNDIQSKEQFYWAGVQNTTFCSILKESNLLRNVTYGPSNEKDTIFASVSSDDIFLKPNEEKVLTFNYYLGPKLFFHMKNFGLSFEYIIDYGSILGPIVKPLVLFLNFLFNLTGNYGIAIILMTIIFKIVTHPLTKKSMVSMKKMQQLQPQMTQIQQQHKDNAMAMQKATMELYKKHGVNPLSGCLPLLIQMPVFIAFYKAISNSVELQGASFLLIKDLAAPDSLIPIGISLPLIGNAIHILPILMAITQFISSKQTTTDPRQKSMIYFFPVFMLVIFYKMPSGLVLYFLVSTFVGIIQNYFIKTTDKS